MEMRAIDLKPAILENGESGVPIKTALKMYAGAVYKFYL